MQAQENQEPTSQNQPRKTRIEIAREKLSKEKYLDFQKKGMADTTIMDSFGIAVDVFYKLKGEWGLTGQKQQDPDPEPEVEKETVPEEKRLTITQALELQEELEEDLDSIEWLLEREDDLSPRVAKLLHHYRDNYQRSINQISEVFNTTRVAI